MSDPEEMDGPVPTPEELDDALAAFWRGSYGQLDQLLGEDDEVSFSSVLAELVAALPHQCLSGPMNESYTITREIGRGGMGIVYEGLQVSTGRNVALKIMQYVSPTDQVSMQLLLREVEILAGLKHPFIATLYDAGHTPESADRPKRPFFAMELVEGQSLTSWSRMLNDEEPAAREKLHARLRLFVQICKAIAYAHQRGIIHRDLKPGNILVVTDGPRRWSPKVLDFGLAALTTDNAQSEQRKAVGTPAYMSPEQREGRIDEIDTRSDVYSLGVILHELLLSRRPGQPGNHESPGLNSELQSILDRALQQDRNARYQSASALGDDVERYLTNLPVFAHPASAAYHIRKLVTRHRLSSSLVAILLLACVGFASALLYQNRRIARERDLANLERARAHEVNAYLSGMFDSIDPANVGASVSVQDVLDRASVELAAAKMLDGQVQASLHDTIGRGYMSLHVFEKSREHLEAALDIKKRIFGENHLACAESLHDLGQLAIFMRERERGEELLNRSYEIRERLAGPDSESFAESICDKAMLAKYDSHYDKSAELYRKALAIYRPLGENSKAIADILRRLGVVLVASGRFEEAMPALEEALTIQRRTLGDDHLEVARTLTDIIEIHEHYAQFALAESMCHEQVRILRKAYPDGHKDLAIALSELANLSTENSNFEDAERLHLEAMSMEQRIESDNALTTNNYSVFLRELGRNEEAEALGHHVAEIWNPNHTHPGAAYAAQNLGSFLLERGCLDDAEALLDRAVQVWHALFGEINPKIANALIGLGRIHEMRGDYVSAENLFRQAASIRELRLGPTNPLTALATIHLARVLQKTGRVEGIELAENQLLVLKAIYGKRHGAISWAELQIAGMYLSAGMTSEAAALYQDIVSIEASLRRPNHPNTAAARNGLAIIASGPVPTGGSRVSSWP